jgi:hypothetical protein
MIAGIIRSTQDPVVEYWPITLGTRRGSVLPRRSGQYAEITLNLGDRMADDQRKTRPQDASRINVHEQYELEYWSKHFGATAEKLKEAVQKVGTSAKAVEAELKRR